MKKYLLVARLSIQDVFEYKFDFFLQSLKYALMVLMMMIVWQAVERNGAAGLMSNSEIVVYFVLSASLYTLSNFHPWYIEDDIRLGYLSKYLVKPISPTLYYFAYEFGRVLTETLLKLCTFIVILFFFGQLPNFSFVRFLLLLLYSPFIFLFAFQWLTLISLLSFWITEAYSIRWAVTITTRLLSGLLVPIVYFPDVLKPYLFYLPFQHLAYTPIELMLNHISFSTFFAAIAILSLWTLLLSLFRQWCWNFGVRNFEGTGL